MADNPEDLWLKREIQRATDLERVRAEQDKMLYQRQMELARINQMEER